ncbi:uncharacterized protein TrAtP1_005448 [Trichoderma atroviride]|uniref:uncharacterized protein n=1 Tax=Hypocrea atroviridis TaxID=63577 RepID=UPI003322BCFD|nr:hypothetical protein TrAtP1_005448 [Trichoderma atroviride]
MTRDNCGYVNDSSVVDNADKKQVRTGAFIQGFQESKSVRLYAPISSALSVPFT